MCAEKKTFINFSNLNPNEFNPSKFISDCNQHRMNPSLSPKATLRLTALLLEGGITAEAALNQVIKEFGGIFSSDLINTI